MFSAALTSAREREKLSKLDLARETGVSYSHIDNIESGRRPPTLETVRKLDRRLHFAAKVLLALIRDDDTTPLHTQARAVRTESVLHAGVVLYGALLL